MKPKHSTVFLSLENTELPSIPEVLLKLVRTHDKEKGDVFQISNIIEKDPALSLKMIHLAQSQALCRPATSPSVLKAVQILGTQTVWRIVYQKATREVLAPFLHGPADILMNFWLHCLRTAYLAEVIAKESGYFDSQSAYLAGLMHDAGKLILLANCPNDYRTIMAESSDSRVCMASEKELTGMTHSQIGAKLVRQQVSGGFIADAIYYHHYPLKKIATAFPLVKIVYAANRLAKKQAVSAAELPEIIDLDWKSSEDRIEEIRMQADSKVRRALALIVADSRAGISKTNAQSRGDGVHAVLLNELADPVAAAGLLQGFLNTPNVGDVLRIFKENLLILLGIEKVIFFLYDAQNNILRGQTVGGSGAAADSGSLILPADLPNSLLVRALHQNEMISSFSTSTPSEAAVCDEQIRMFLGKQGWFCIPLSCHEGPEGIAVLGINQAETGAVLKHKKLIERMAEHTASVLHTHRFRQEKFDNDLSENLKSLYIQVRKVVHEVNNPLNIVKNYLQILESKLAETNVAGDEFEIIRNEMNRIGDTLRTLTSKARERRPHEALVDLNSLILNITKLINASLLQDSITTIHLDLDDTLPPTALDPHLFTQAVQNLIKNAVEAMPNGGNIYVQTYVQTRSGGQTSPPPGHSVESAGALQAVVVIQDDGPGLPDEVKVRLFEPFVTTKHGHDGLGLSIIKNMVQKMQGSVTCESKTGEGTRFTIQLPVGSKKD